MPRTARLDISGVLHHVIVRGIEKSPIFIDDHDRLHFVSRLSKLLLETGTECHAWALLDNHFHLLVQPRSTKLATFMRRLLTGHAITFNLRHKRSGHLFQNRYKSIICDEDPYFLELVRYIHLNPLRAGIVTGMDQLDCYPWCGHAVVMGNNELQGQQCDSILHRFDSDVVTARQAYRLFVADGIMQGVRDDLVGGGLRRNLPADDAKLLHDARILGNDRFVESLLLASHGDRPVQRVLLADLADRAAELSGISVELLSQRLRTKNVSTARSLFCYCAVLRCGYSGVDVAVFLNQSRAGVCVAARRGEQLVSADPVLKMVIDGWLKG